MAQAARVGDVAVGADGAPVEAKGGSPDVFINGLAALRADDAASEDASGAAWQATGGSRGVLINGMPAMRTGDATDHGGGAGQVADGSPDVMLGDLGGGTPKERPHDRAVTIEFTDALGRAIDEVVVDVFCPHHPSERTTIDSKTTASGLCSGSTVSVHKGLAGGTWDANAHQVSPAQSHHVIGDPEAGGAPAPSGDASPASRVVHAPAPAGSSPAQQSVHLARPNGGTTAVKFTTVHNWVELVYKAFGHTLPTGQLDLALLGVREASLAAAAGTAPARDTIEKEAGWGDVDEVSYTREHKAPAYNDLLFCAYTDKHVKTKQIVEVFECTIDASPSKGPLHLPFLQEAQLYHCKPGPWHTKHYPGHDIALHVFSGKHEPKPEGHATAQAVIALAHSQIGTLEHGDNEQKYGAWYGENGVYWCAEFVSWVMAHSGLSEIRYAGCSDGWGHFESGAWGTWHSSRSTSMAGLPSGGPQTATAEPGDVVFYQWDSDSSHTHTGIVVKDLGSEISTIEGNTELQDGSNPNGGGVHPRVRPKDYTVVGFGRPRYKKPTDPVTSVIRWGGEGGKIETKYSHDQTLLHHHYFAEQHGHEKPDPKAARYRRFMHLYREAKNAKLIPYLIVSSHYVKSYAEWVTWVDENPGKVPQASTVLRREGLVALKEKPHLFVPSYMSPAYAEGVLRHAHHMHDRHKAAKLVDELEAAMIRFHT